MLALMGSQMGCVDKRRCSIKAACGRRTTAYDVYIDDLVAKKRGCEGVLLLLLLCRRHCRAEIMLENATEDAGT